MNRIEAEDRISQLKEKIATLTDDAEISRLTDEITALREKYPWMSKSKHGANGRAG